MLKARLSDFFAKHESSLEIAFFIGGFIFDIWMLAAPDEVISIIQQASYLAVIAVLVHYELLHRLVKWRPQGMMIRIWNYRTFIMHFLLGSLLSVYSLFYIKSASVFSSFVFLLFIIGLLLANELPAIKRANVSFKIGLYAICVFSFLSILFPILFGFVGFVPFIFSLLTTLAILYLQYKQLWRVIPEQPVLFRAVMAPAGSVMILFFVFYFLGWIPPVPLSVKTQGVYHFVEKKDGNYLLSYEREWPYFFRDSDKNFKAIPGDKIYFFAQIYSPARISDEVVIHWHQKNKKDDWELMDKIPLKIQGGRELGYRGYAFKSNYTPGEWKIEVRTSSGIEISRYYFTVQAAAETDARSFFMITK